MDDSGVLRSASLHRNATAKIFAPKEVSGTVELKVIKERYGTTSVESKVKQRELVIPSFLRDMGK